MSYIDRVRREDAYNDPQGIVEDAISRAGWRAPKVFGALPDGALFSDFVGGLIAEAPALPAVEADKIAARQLRRLSRRPPRRLSFSNPDDPFSYVVKPPAQADFDRRRTAMDMRLEKRAAERAVPRAEPEVPKRLTPEQLRAQAAAAVARRREAIGFPPPRTLRWVDYERGGTYDPPSWLVRNLLPRRGLGLLYGESSAGKTFLAIHASLCLAWGVPFFGRRAKPGGVLYIAAEGGRSVLPRFDAAERALGVGAANLTGQRDRMTGCAPIRIAYEAPNLSRDGDPAPLVATIREAVEQFEAAGSRLAMVVVDTWHAALGGADENSAADAGHALKPLKDAIEEMGVFVLVVHHPGKDVEKGARGSASLPAAVDTVIELRVPGCMGPLAKPSDMMRTAIVTKQRDGSVGDMLHYRLPITTLGLDEEGEPWTTCTVQPCDPPKLDGDGLSKTDRQFMEAVEAAIAEVGGNGRAEFEKARGRFYNARSSDKPDTRRKAWNRALAEAVKAGRVEIDDHDRFIWIPAEPAGERDTDTGS